MRIQSTRVVQLPAWAGVRPSMESRGLYARVNIEGTVALLGWARDRRAM